MRESERRHEMAFLALAVAVLAIAVALFVVMRSIPKQRAGSSVEATQEEVTETAEQVEEPAPTEGRDPFRSQAGRAGGTAVGPQAELRLVGITREEGREAMATIRAGRRHYYVRAGEKIGADKVVSIGENEVVLERDGGRITLVLRVSGEEE
ncbi:MAG: hypothetical protein JSV79_08095 [Armatimonadota bacterium]|nr:MAG: hypothetical protein JSV79_08095 [Armatimonadota bacterium]